MRAALVLTIAAVLCAGCGSKHAAGPTGPPPSLYRGLLIKPPEAAPSFGLHDQSGAIVGAQSERGHWLVVAFLYTHCPDVCPLIASNLGAALRQMPNLRVLAVSVDPKGDTPAAVRAFIRNRNLPPRFRYLTGSRPELAPVWKRFHVATLPGPNGSIGHSAFELLIDPSGKERVLYDATVRAVDIAHDVKRLTA